MVLAVVVAVNSILLPDLDGDSSQLLYVGSSCVPPGVMSVALVWCGAASLFSSAGSGVASSKSRLLPVGLRTLLLVIKPMAEGVGVLGGGFVGVLATFRLLFGVTGGGGMAVVSSLVTLDTPFDVTFVGLSVVLGFRPRFLDATGLSTSPASEYTGTAVGFACTRVDRLKDMLRCVTFVVM